MYIIYNARIIHKSNKDVVKTVTGYSPLVPVLYEPSHVKEALSEMDTSHGKVTPTWNFFVSLLTESYS